MIEFTKYSTHSMTRVTQYWKYNDKVQQKGWDYLKVAGHQFSPKIDVACYCPQQMAGSVSCDWLLIVLYLSYKKFISFLKHLVLSPLYCKKLLDKNANILDFIQLQMTPPYSQAI